jgi:TetR/AcrR family transcriptional regulator, regulator of cefoperazone and chloramphenicol sensitivity
MNASRIAQIRPQPAADVSGGDSTREKLLDVAGRVFAEHGYQASTVREICAQTGSNVAAVNYHFRDKLGLYTEVLQRSIRASHMEAMRDALDRDGPPEEILRAVIRARLGGVCRGDLADQKLRIFLHELTQPTPALDRVLRELTAPLYQGMLELIGKLIGSPPQDETTRLCAHSIMGQIMLYALASPLFGRVWPDFKMTPKRTERIAEHIADFSLAYLREVAEKHRHRTSKLHAKAQNRRRK